MDKNKELFRRTLAKLKGEVSTDEEKPVKVQVANDSIFYVGQQVRYRVATQSKTCTNYQWVEYVGHVEMLDHANHWVLVEPDQEASPLLWVPFAYVEPLA